MLIAKAKRKENIIEYVLYMYQVEDMIRSLQLDIDMVQKLIVEKFEQPKEVQDQILKWYIELTEALIQEDKTKSGHLNFLVQQVKELQDLHTELLGTEGDDNYKAMYEKAKPILMELVMRSGGSKLINEIDVAINGLYGYLVLKLKKAEISEATESSMNAIKEMLGHLAFQFKKREEGI